MARNIGYLTAKKSRASDECYTPKYAVLPILEFLKNRFKYIWCPFDNDTSEYVKVLKKNGFKVINTHIDNSSGDFFKIKPPKKFDIIISNPPYSLKDKVIKRCYELEKPFMLLMPLPTLQGKNRYNYFSKGIEVLVFDGRISYFANGHTNSVQDGNSFASCYFCRNVLPTQLMFRRLENYKHD